MANMNICEEFLESFIENKLTGWKAELATTFSNFKIQKLYGNSYDFGDFEKCINFMSADGHEQVQGKYCSVQYYSTSSDVVSVMPRESFFNQGWKHLDTRFGGAVCIPSICDSNYLVPRIMEVMLKNTNYVMSPDYNQDEYCQVKKNFQWTASGIFGICFVLSFILLSVYSTIKSRRNKESIFSSFCLIRNTKILFLDENKDETIDYLRGLKTISYLVTAFIHMILASLYYPSTNPKNVLEYHTGAYEMVVSQGAAGASFCTMITSFLLTKALWKLLEHGRLNIPLLYIYRYLRIVPLIFFMMVVEKFIMHDWVSTFIEAPHFFPNQFSRVFKYYWLPLLQIQNYFVDIKETFMPASYYFAVDFHLFMATPLVIYLIWKWKRLRFVIFPLLLVTSIYVNFSYILDNKEYFRDMKYLSYEDKVLSKYVQETQFALPGWIFGMMFGYFTITHKTVEINKNKKIYLWSIPVILVSVWISRVKFSFLKDYIVYLIPFDKFYHSIVFVMFLFFCHYGHQDVITKFLSLKFWVPLDRLGLSILISHAVLYRWMLIPRKSPFEYTLSSITEYYIYGIIASIIYGLFLNLLIEQPIINLFKFYITTSKQKKKST